VQPLDDLGRQHLAEEPVVLPLGLEHEQQQEGRQQRHLRAAVRAAAAGAMAARSADCWHG
jgi:hypothetical protein